MNTRCVICGEPFPARNHRSVLCGQPECVAARKRQYVAKTRAKYPGHAREYSARQFEAIRTLIGRIRRRRGENDAMRKRDEVTQHPLSCFSKARDDEMTFVLLGRDVAAPAAIRAWIAERVRLGKNRPDDAQIQGAEMCARTMETERDAGSPGLPGATTPIQPPGNPAREGTRDVDEEEEGQG